MRLFALFVIATSCLFASNSDALTDECNGKAFGSTGVFDFYVLAQSWSAGFCAQGHTSYPGCQSPTNFMKTNLTMHGLWPNYKVRQSGNPGPQCCKDGQYSQDLSQSTVDTLKTPLQLYWPNEQDPSVGSLKNSLYFHEWNKHGVCSGLDQIPYFKEAMLLHTKPQIAIPPLIVNNIGSSISRDELFGYYNDGSSCKEGSSCMVGFTCGTGSQLNGILTCWSKDFQQMSCPAATVGSWTCTSTINIQSF